METNSEAFIQCKVAITLRKLLAKIKECETSTENKSDVINSYQKIANNTNFNLRKATVTAAFSGKTKSAMTTVISIVISMGYTMGEFAIVYDSISNEEILESMKRGLHTIE